MCYPYNVFKQRYETNVTLIYEVNEVWNCLRIACDVWSPVSKFSWTHWRKSLLVSPSHRQCYALRKSSPINCLTGFLQQISLSRSKSIFRNYSFQCFTNKKNIVWNVGIWIIRKRGQLRTGRCGLMLFHCDYAGTKIIIISFSGFNTLESCNSQYFCQTLKK